MKNNGDEENYIESALKIDTPFKAAQSAINKKEERNSFRNFDSIISLLLHNCFTIL